LVLAVASANFEESSLIQGSRLIAADGAIQDANGALIDNIDMTDEVLENDNIDKLQFSMLAP